MEKSTLIMKNSQTFLANWLFSLLSISMIIMAVTAKTEAKNIRCFSNSIVRYRLSFNGAWSEESFPRQYPKFRPPAQWSKMIGRSHDDDYRLWVKGTVSDAGIQEFAESGEAGKLEEKDAQGFNGIYDSFIGSPVKSGIGRSEVDFFAQTNHSKVSAIIKIIPSPDWFVGVDSLDLCQDGHWVWAKNVSLHPMDAGTDQGLTFTSPNWVSNPREKIYQISSSFPAHRANSFFYKDREDNPPIGYLNIQLLTSAKHLREHKQVTHQRENNNEIRPTESKEGDETNEEEIGTKRNSTSDSDRIVAQTAAPLFGREKRPALPVVRQTLPISDRRNPPFRTRSNNQWGSSAPKGIVSGRVVAVASRTRSRNTPKRRIVCEVSEWAKWSECSKTCGLGSTERRRSVTVEPSRGQRCPQLRQTKWCGSMRHCNDRGSMFSWLSKDSSSTTTSPKSSVVKKSSAAFTSRRSQSASSRRRSRTRPQYSNTSSSSNRRRRYHSLRKSRTLKN